MERIAIERVPAAWKCSLESRPYEGMSSAGGRFQSSWAILERNLKDYVGLLEARKTRRILLGRAPITTKQFVEDLKAAFI
jgi:hypothetical protein